MTARVSSYVAQKGGVGKSMTTVQSCLLTALKLKKRTLLIDIDPQKNSSGVFVSSEDIENNPDCYASLLYMQNYEVKPIKGKYGIDVIPGDDGINAFPQDLTDDAFANLLNRLAKNEKATANDVIKEVVDLQLVAFASNVQKLREHYDYIFIDTPPSFLGLPLISALCACTDVVGLLEPNKFSSDVIEGFIDKVNTIHEEFNPEMIFHGFIINKFRGSSQRHKKRAAEWIAEYPDFFVADPIRINSWLEDCTEDGEPCWKLANNSNRRAGAKSLLNAIATIIPEIRSTQ